MSSIHSADIGRFDTLTNQAGTASPVGVNSSEVAVTYLTPTNGAPGAGQYRSEISGRAPIVDPTNDLGVRLGVDRYETKTLIPVPEEFVSGKRVQKPINDRFNMCRFVGNWTQTVFATANQNNGWGVYNTSATGNPYIEIVFLGTGLNMLVVANDSTQVVKAVVDGGADSADLVTAGQGGSIFLRYYNANCVLPVTSGLSYGLHTVKIRMDTGNTVFFGYEVLNETVVSTVPQLKTSAGIGYFGIKGTLAAVDTQPYNATFETGTLGTKGGAVLVYMKADGTIKKAVTPTNATSRLVTSVGHSDEEVLRVYHWREFSWDITNDFSTLIPSVTTNKAFILDDGSTALVGSNVRRDAVTTTYDNPNINAANGYFYITFTGTGLDIVVIDNSTGGGDVVQASVNNGTLTTYQSTGSTSIRTVQIASGYPYGTHVVQLKQSTIASYSHGISHYIVYGPKTPALPAGAMALASYNIMANFVADNPSTVQTNSMSTGVLRKYNSREMIYSGGWTLNADVSDPGYWLAQSSNTNDYIEYSFVGVGVVTRLYISSQVTNITWSIDGSTNLSGFTTSLGTQNTGLTFTASTGILSGTSVQGANGRAVINITGLTYGKHTVRLTRNAGHSGVVTFTSFDILPGLHSHKNAGPYIEQCAGSIGSQGVKDLRTFGSNAPMKGVKASVAKGQYSNTSTGSSVPGVVLTDLMTPYYAEWDQTIEISSWISLYCSGSDAALQYNIVVDGVHLARDMTSAESILCDFPAQGQVMPCTAVKTHEVAKGWHIIYVTWYAQGNTANALGNARQILVRPVGSNYNSF